MRLKDGAPKLMAALHEAEYTAKLENADLTAVEIAVRDITANDTVVVSRVVKGTEKKIDIRPMIVSLSLTGDTLVMRLSASQNALLRPDVLLGELRRRAGDFDCAVTRTGLFTLVDGAPQPLLDALGEQAV